jgi:hypothetical protein
MQLRNIAAKSRDVVFRQKVTEEEIANRKLLKERCPDWEDSWVHPKLLTNAQLSKAATVEVARVSDETLARWRRLDPDNGLFTREIKKRDSNVDDEHLHRMTEVMVSSSAGFTMRKGRKICECCGYH